MNKVKQWLKECTHNCLVHPLMMFLPVSVGNKLHDKNANWCWGLKRYDELLLETSTKSKSSPEDMYP